MKNISERSSKLPLPVMLLLIAGFVCLCAAETFEINEMRAAYFIIEPDAGTKIDTGSTGALLTDRSMEPAGTCKVIDVHEGRCLCIVESVKPGINTADLTRVSFKKEDNAPDSRRASRQPAVEPMTVGDIRFTRLNNDKEYYLSGKPVRVKNIEPAAISGIKKVLFQIEEETNKRFRADLVSLEHIDRLGLHRYFKTTGDKKIFLGTKAGKIGMIYEENTVLQHMEISPGTLDKFKENMYFYIILKKKTKTDD